MYLPWLMLGWKINGKSEPLQYGETNTRYLFLQPKSETLSQNKPCQNCENHEISLKF